MSFARMNEQVTVGNKNRRDHDNIQAGRAECGDEEECRAR